MTPFALEIGVALLMLIVLGAGLIGGDGGRRCIVSAWTCSQAG